MQATLAVEQDKDAQIRSLQRIICHAIEARFDQLQKSIRTKERPFQHYCERTADRKMVHHYGHGMRFAFRTRDNRFVVLFLYGPANYVFSFEREFSREDMKEATGYSVSPHPDWKFTGYHDSCWRDKIHDFIYKYGGMLETVGFLHFGDKMPITEEMHSFMRAKEKERRNRHIKKEA